MIAGRERLYLDRFYNELSADPRHIGEATRAHYAALYSRPHAIHDAFSQFEAFRQDGADNQKFLAEGKLAMPVLAIGGEKALGKVSQMRSNSPRPMFVRLASRTRAIG